LETFAALKASATLGTHATSQIVPNAKITTIALEANTRLGIVTNINLGPLTNNKVIQIILRPWI
jgi:hypothetical protein